MIWRKFHCAIIPLNVFKGARELEELDAVKSWVLGLIIGPALGLLLWYFKRSQSQTDKRLDGFDADFDEVRTVLAKKVDREEMAPVWEKIRIQDQDIKNLGAAFSRELREQIDTLRREGNDHQRQTNERLDKILTIIATGREK